MNNYLDEWIRMGKLAKVNLETATIKIEEVTDAEEEQYIGGTGFAAAHFIQNIPPNIKPYDKENLLIISSGLSVTIRKEFVRIFLPL